eukprot:174192_1
MGKCMSKNPDTELTQELNNDKKKDKAVKKLLFLGSGGSGKSTIFKQLRTIHGDGWTKKDRMTFVDHIHSQIVEQMRLAVDCIEYLAEQEFGDEEERNADYKRPEDFNAFQQLSNDAQKAIHTLQSAKSTKLTEDAAQACQVLWNEPTIKSIYAQRATMKIEDSSAYFWDKIDQVLDPSYVPDPTDILMVRYRTTGVIEQKFVIQKNMFHIFDVGGQKSERKKWIHCFEGVTALIFVASLSCYDEVMFEDETVNSMVDTLQLFDKISNNLYFVKTSVILFLNKKDLFAEKLESGKAITLCPEFRDYDGDAKSFEDATDYVRDVFVRKSRSNKTIFTHLTCATDTENVDKVFNDVQQIIIENSLISAGLMGEMMETEDDENRNLIPTAQAGATANDKDQLLQSQAGAVISVCEENE